MKKKENLKALFYPDVPFDTLFIPYIYREIYFEGIYVDVLNQGKDMVIVDVGSNIGVTVQHFKEYAKKVYAIEPSPEHFEALKKNKEFNGWDNVEVFNMAIADKCGTMHLSQNSANRTCNSIVLNYGDKGVEVETMDFETFFNQNKIESVDFMKFDVEGAEDLILRGDSFRKVAHKIKNIMVEFHYPSWRDLVEYMISLGYQARQYESSAIVVMFFR